MTTRDIILLAEYLLHRERDTSPFTSYSEAVKVATLLDQHTQPNVLPQHVLDALAHVKPPDFADRVRELCSALHSRPTAVIKLGIYDGGSLVVVYLNAHVGSEIALFSDGTHEMVNSESVHDAEARAGVVQTLARLGWRYIIDDRPNVKPDVGVLIERDGRAMRFTGDAWETLVPITRCEIAELKAEQHAEAAQGFARVAELLLGPGRHAYTIDSIVAAVQQLLLAQASGTALRMPALYSTRQAIADAGLPVTLSAADAVKQLAAQREENAAKYLALLADFDKLREQARRSEHTLAQTLDSVQRERDALAATIAASKEPKQMPQRIYDTLTHVWPQDFADRIAKVGNALAAIGVPLDCERISDRAGRFDLLLPAHNSRVQIRANGEAVVTGEAAHLVELGGLKADIEHVLRADGWKVSG